MKQIEDKVERTLSSLDGIEKASPKPFFFTRLSSRIESKPKMGTSNAFSWRLVVVPATVLALNFFVFWDLGFSTQSEGINNLTWEYYDESGSFYQYLNEAE